MAKVELAQIKLQLPAGKANPSPPVGPALSQHGVNIMEFCKAFNAETQGQEGMVIPVVISVYKDRSFSYIMKTPPAAILLKKAAGIVKGTGTAGRETVGSVTKKPVEEIATHFDGSPGNIYVAKDHSFYIVDSIGRKVRHFSEHGQL